MIKDNLTNIYKELPSEVKLVAVSKFHPIEAIVEAYEAGQRTFGESRPQEFEKKMQWLSAKRPDILSNAEFQFIGHLQTNKLKMVLPYVSMVQSVDSVHLLEAVDKWGRDNGRQVDILLEMHLGAEETKQGFAEDELLDIMFRLSDGKYSGVNVRGLMGMATNTEDESTVDADFERIDSYMAYLVDLFPELEGFDQLSIGMSGDWKIAIRHGATMVRIGTAIFGERA